MQCAAVDILLWKCSENWDWIESILGFSSSKAKQWLQKHSSDLCDGTRAPFVWMGGCVTHFKRKAESFNISKHKIYIQTGNAAWKLSLTWQDHTDTHQAQIDTHMYAMNHPKLLSTFFLSSATGNVILRQAKVSEWDVLLKASLVNYLKGLISASGGFWWNPKTRQMFKEKLLQRRYRWVWTRKNSKHKPLFKNTDREGGSGRSQFPDGKVEDGGKDRGNDRCVE